MIQGVDHVQVSIPIGSEAVAKEFYCAFFGLPEIEKPENLKSRSGFWLRAGNLPVHFGVEDGIDRTRSKAHVAYVDFRDPFGNRIEFIQWLSV